MNDTNVTIHSLSPPLRMPSVKNYDYISRLTIHIQLECSQTIKMFLRKLKQNRNAMEVNIAREFLTCYNKKFKLEVVELNFILWQIVAFCSSQIMRDIL